MGVPLICDRKFSRATRPAGKSSRQMQTLDVEKGVLYSYYVNRQTWDLIGRLRRSRRSLIAPEHSLLCHRIGRLLHTSAGDCGRVFVLDCARAAACCLDCPHDLV